MKSSSPASLRSDTIRCFLETSGEICCLSVRSSSELRSSGSSESKRRDVGLHSPDIIYCRNRKLACSVCCTVQMLIWTGFSAAVTYRESTGWTATHISRSVKLLWRKTGSVGPLFWIQHNTFRFWCRGRGEPGRMRSHSPFLTTILNAMSQQYKPTAEIKRTKQNQGLCCTNTHSCVYYVYHL